ncbi:HNH endonuclease signature motif containing protein [Brachybacterium sp. AOP42-B2-9]|uniref:HNH endonuclease signature motif containing protein n=1 Tax=Brachybacterium sp. AOP42-B2-9 TaxID=3457672 RepID=UPI004034C902
MDQQAHQPRRRADLSTRRLTPTGLIHLEIIRLRLRDTTCTFPGCHQSRHLDAHHLVPWSEGGRTDIDGLALLCRRHHVMVHEGGMRVVHDAGRSSPHQPRLLVRDSSGRPVQARWPAMLEHVRVREQSREESASKVDAGGGSAEEGAAQSPLGPIALASDGIGFSLAACVDALCESLLDESSTPRTASGAA